MDSPKFVITQNINSYRRRLEISYEEDNSLLKEIMETAAVFVNEGVEYDNWNNRDIYGHDITLFLPEEVLRKTGNIKAQSKLGERLKDDFNECVGGVSGEFVNNLSIELFDEENPACKNAFLPATVNYVDPEKLDIWESGYIRLFISHKNKYKKEAALLGEYLNKSGVSCFVAHDTIEPMSKWQKEIWKALMTMEVLLAFITDDFSEGDWTDQELGVALGRGIPIIPLKIQSKPPHGFISETQAVKGGLEDLESTSNQVFETIVNKIDQKGRLKTAAIEAWANSSNFYDTMDSFKRLNHFDGFTGKHIERIISAFNANDQLYNCRYLGVRDRFIEFLNLHSDKKYDIKNRKVIEQASEVIDDIPF